MNEFVAKKLGEVLAFSRIGIELFERGEGALRKEFETTYDDTLRVFSEQAEAIVAAAEEGGVGETTNTKAEATSDKLRGMMETYIGDEWDNIAELLEWMGFFEGAAVVHWKLVEGAADALEASQLLDLARSGSDLHHNLFHAAQVAITGIGAERSRA